MLGQSWIPGFQINLWIFFNSTLGKIKLAGGALFPDIIPSTALMEMPLINLPELSHKHPTFPLNLILIKKYPDIQQAVEIKSSLEQFGLEEQEAGEVNHKMLEAD